MGDGCCQAAGEELPEKELDQVEGMYIKVTHVMMIDEASYM